MGGTGVTGGTSGTGGTGGIEALSSQLSALSSKLQASSFKFQAPSSLKAAAARHSLFLRQLSIPAAIASAIRRRRAWFQIASSPSGVVMKSVSTRQLGISGFRVTAKFACITPLFGMSP